MVDRNAVLGLVPETGGPDHIELEADGQFHVVLGTKEEHDGIKVQATNPAVVRLLLEQSYFRPQTYYCRVEDGSGRKLEPDELADDREAVERIDGVEGMVPYDAVSLGRDGDARTVGDLIGK